jgi:hypothetical protein
MEPILVIKSLGWVAIALPLLSVVVVGLCNLADF